MPVGCEKEVSSALDEARIVAFYVNHQLSRAVQILSLNAPSSMLLLMSDTTTNKYNNNSQCRHTDLILLCFISYHRSHYITLGLRITIAHYQRVIS